MKYHVTIDGQARSVEVRGTQVTVDGEEYDVDLVPSHDGTVHSLIVGGAPHRVAATGGRGRWDLLLGGHRVRAEVVDARTMAVREMMGRGAQPSGPGPVVAPMPGLVIRLEVSEGDVVEEGQGVIIVEAMKMENELVAEGAGVVETVHVREGDAVEKGQLLVTLSPSEEGGDVDE